MLSKKNIICPDNLLKLAKTKGYSLSQRFHITLWDQTTGV